MTSAAAVSALILDLDGVVRHWSDEPVTEIEKAYGLPRGSVIAAAHAVPEYELGVRGHVTFDDWCAATAEELARRCGSAARGAVDQWRRYRGDVDRDVVAAIIAIQPDLPVALLSNAHDCRPRRRKLPAGMDRLSGRAQRGAVKTRRRGHWRRST